MKTRNRTGSLVVVALALGAFTTPAALARGTEPLLSKSRPSQRSAYSPRTLTSGTPFSFTIGPVTTNTLFSGDYSAIIHIPTGATRLDIQLSTTPSSADVDLYARYSADVDLLNGDLVADHFSEGMTGAESLIINSASTPPLRAGDYYIAVGLFTHNVTATVTLTATVTGGTTSGPLVPANGVVNAADGAPVFSPGTILSIYGTNLATGIAAGTLPMQTTMLGTSVDVSSGGQTLAAPLFFVSPGQINAQLPYEAAVGAARVRVRTAAGTGTWIDIAVQATAPRLLTYDMTGRGAAIAQHAATYSLVNADNPAQRSEMLVLYLIGLGATQPPARTGIAAGDGATLGALNVTPNVNVTIGGTSAQVIWAGLTPGLVGLYQINLVVPANVAAGDIVISVGCAGANSQTNVTTRIASAGTATISISGGSVSGSGTTVTVPPGTFDQPATIHLTAVTGLPTPTDGRVTAVTRVEGLPSVVRQPIRLALDVTGPPPNGKALVVVRFEEDDGRGPMILPAEIVNNQIVASLPAMPPDTPVPDAVRGAVVDSNPLNAALWGMAGMGEEASPQGKANVHYPVGETGDFDLAIQVGNLVDETFTKLQTIGVDTSRRKGPVEVYLFSFASTLGKITLADADAEGETETELWGRASVGLSLNLDVVRNKGTEAVRTTVGHETFHILQGLYDPRPLWRRSYIKSPWLWMMEGASTWFEEKMSRSSGYLSPNALANADFLLKHGLEYAPGGKTEVSRHGYGASVFLEYMTQYKNDTFAGEIFREMEPSSGTVFLTPKYSPVEGLYNQEVLLGFKWTDFVQRYAAAQVHPGLSLNNLIASAKTETYTFASDNDAGTSYQWAAPDLSAHLYKVEFKKWPTAWPAGTKVTLQLSGPPDAEMTVWKAQTGSGWVMLAKTGASYEIADAEKLAASGAVFAVLVANGTMNRPYDKTSPVTFEIKGPPVVSVFPVGAPLFAINLESDTAIEVKRTEAWANEVPRVFIRKQWFSWEADNGARCPSCTVGMMEPLTWNGRNFSTKLDLREVPEANCVYTRKINVSGQVSPDAKSLLTLSAEWDNVTRCPYANTDESFGFTLQNIPFTVYGTPSPGWVGIRGGLQGKLGNVHYAYHMWDGTRDYTTEVLSVDYAAADWLLEILFDLPHQ